MFVQVTNNSLLEITLVLQLSDNIEIAIGLILHIHGFQLWFHNRTTWGVLLFGSEMPPKMLGPQCNNVQRWCHWKVTGL